MEGDVENAELVPKRENLEPSSIEAIVCDIYLRAGVQENFNAEVELKSTPSGNDQEFLTYFNEDSHAEIAIFRPSLNSEVVLHATNFEPTIHVRINSETEVPLWLQDGSLYQSRQFEIWIFSGKAYLYLRVNGGTYLRPLTNAAENNVVSILGGSTFLTPQDLATEGEECSPERRDTTQE